ncbi:MAG: 4Fe-4S dicluster domain-containing protein [Deltaproteobacteria bacterium]|nr:4Fe-4S dicluster domain-containing protein [Deltaproteobacteria bacterium]
MPKWGMVIDLDKCTACKGCVVACMQENNVSFAGQKGSDMGRVIHWMDMLTISEGEYPHIKSSTIPRPCLHCDHPPCIKVCPVGATYRSPEGIVGQIHARCIGCRYCTTACPYTVRYFNWYAPEWPGEMADALNPDVSVRPKGVVEKCSFCHHRLIRAREQARMENREMQPSEYQPACAEMCPTRAIVFGDLADPSSEVATLSRSSRAWRLLEDLGTEPKVIYLREGD